MVNAAKAWNTPMRSPCLIQTGFVTFRDACLTIHVEMADIVKGMKFCYPVMNPGNEQKVWNNYAHPRMADKPNGPICVDTHAAYCTVKKCLSHLQFPGKTLCDNDNTGTTLTKKHNLFNLPTSSSAPAYPHPSHNEHRLYSHPLQHYSAHTASD